MFASPVLRRTMTLAPAVAVVAMLAPAGALAASFSARHAASIAEGVLIQQAHKQGVALTRAHASAKCTPAQQQVNTYKCTAKASNGTCTGTMQVYATPPAGYKTRAVRVHCR